jgi:ferredoxin
MLDERPQHCTMECNLCATACPTDALHTPTFLEARQLGLGKVARVDYSRCVAAVRGEQCMRCRGACPIIGAITQREETVVWHGREKTAPIPIVVEELCVACGMCTDVCPVGPPAIVVAG